MASGIPSEACWTSADDVRDNHARRDRGRIGACHKNVQAMYDYWLAKRGSRTMPARADLEPAEIKKLLPMMVLVDVTADARRFVYRLVGTQEAAERGSDPTGKTVAEAFFGALSRRP